jgi:CheY-like chemotaxis protein
MEGRAPTSYARVDAVEMGAIRLSETRELVRVLVVDDHEPFRSVLKAMLEGAQGVTVVAEAGNGVQALELEAKLDVDVALLDLHMPVMGGPRGVRVVSKGRRIAAPSRPEVQLGGSIAKANVVVRPTAPPNAAAILTVIVRLAAKTSR